MRSRAALGAECAGRRQREDVEALGRRRTRVRARQGGANDGRSSSRERSGGTLPVKVYPGATLAQRDPRREFVALRDGAADLAVGSTLHWSAQVAELTVVGLPWLAPERERARGARDGRDDASGLFAAIERAGAVPLALAPLGHRALATHGAIRAPARRPRAASRSGSRRRRYLVDFYAGLGALPFAMPFAEARAAFAAAGSMRRKERSRRLPRRRLDALGVRDVTLLGRRRGARRLRGQSRGVGRLDRSRAQASSATPRRRLRASLPALAAAEHDAALATLQESRHDRDAAHRERTRRVRRRRPRRPTTNGRRSPARISSAPAEIAVKAAPARAVGARRRMSADEASEPHGGLALSRAARRHDQHAVVVRRADLGVAVAREQRAGLRRRPRGRCTGIANANSSVAIVTAAVTSITFCAGVGSGSRCASRNAAIDHAEVAQEAQRRLPARLRRRRASQCWPHSISSALRGSSGSSKNA